MSESHGSGALEPAALTAEEVLDDVITLRRRVVLGVYGVITADLPAYYFLFGYTIMEVFVLAVVGWVVAGATIYLAFREIIRRSKRSAYPSSLIVEVSEILHYREAAVHALDVIRGLIRPQAAFLTLADSADSHSLLAAHAVTPEAANERLALYKNQLETALGNKYPMEVTGAGDDVRIMLVPLVALKRAVGVLYLADRRSNKDLADRQLLSAIGAAVGMSLDNLRQKEELLKKESRLRSLMTGAPVILFAVDNSGVTTFFEGKGLERLGVGASALVGRPVEEVYANYPQILQSFRRAFAGEEVVSTVTVEREGVRVVYEYRLRPEKTERGRVVGIIGVATDVTERKAAEDALHESQRALETLVENLPGFAYRCLNDKDWTIEFISDGIHEITRYPAEAFTSGRVNYEQVIHPDDREMVRQKVQQAIDAFEHFQVEYRVLTASNEERWVWDKGQAIYGDNGEVLALEGFASEVTESRRAGQALAESEQRYRDLFENSLDAMLSYDFGGRFLTANARCLELFGYTMEEFLALGVGQVVPPEYHVLAAESLRHVYQGDESPYELEVLTRDGGRVPIEITSRIVFDEAGDPLSVQAIARDISERKQTEAALRESEARYRDLFENANDIIFTHDAHGRFGSINRKAEEVGGYTRNELMGRTVWDVLAPEYREIAAENARRNLEGKDPGPFELEIVTRGGKRIPVEVSERVLKDADGKPVLIQGIARDISERRQAEETIRRLAYHDGLTDLPNRALFEDRLRLALAQARRNGEQVAVMFLDLDSFKVVNDTLGHGTGDRLLQAVARDLLAIIREGDTVARVGGDEFTMLLPGIEHPEDATDVAIRILDCLRRPRITDGQEFLTTGSIGITTFPADGSDAESLLRNADTAMYRAKERGRDQYQLYTPAMNERMRERLAFEGDLRHALARREFRVYYQPILNVATGRLTGAEALLRWQHPERGLILPNEFIPFAEESGLIVEIGEAVLEDACTQLAAWEEAGLVVPRVAVNLSARQLQQEDLVSRIEQVLRRTGVSPERVQLEITEGAVLRNMDYINAVLHELRKMGVGIALDDFGTGYSSLTHLKRFPINAVKIDQSFVRDLERDTSDATIVSTVIAMAENLQLQVIAEGVETANQLAFLRQRGCNEFQGYLVSRPVPPAEFVDLPAVRTEFRRPALNGGRAPKRLTAG